ncbi:MAG: MarR family transcriptional regulator [Terracidiphilus sp.]|jgi:DNA-binding MarR family transcriptional regulator
MTNRISENSQNIAGQIHSSAIHLLRKLRREDEQSGLNAPRLSALSVIVFAGPITLGHLATAEQVRPPTMTRIVDALAGQQLVVRKKNAKDGRSTYIEATPAGRKLLMRGRKRRVSGLASQIAALSLSERAILRKAAAILERVVAQI